MSRATLVLMAALILGPATALAHGPNEHPADPKLHVGDKFSECWVEFSPELTQSAFHKFVREFGSVSAFKSVASPVPMGQWSVAFGIEQSNFTIEEHDPAWNDTFVHPDSYHELGADKAFPQVRVRLGVADRVDLGAYYTKSPNANYGWLGLEARYAMLQQSESMPVTLGVRGAYTRTLYVSDMDLNAFTGDLSVGRTFWGAVTPYVGVGGDWLLAHETSGAVELADEDQYVQHATTGLELRYWHVGLGAEANWGALPSYQFQVMVRF